MNWNANLYDQKHDFVSKYGEDLVTLLNPQKGEDILDLGCGTGDLTEVIRSTGAHVIGMDNSEQMIQTARLKYPLIEFEKQSAENFSFNKQFDAVFSNATLHWVLQKEKVISCIHQCLKTNGRFVAEFGGKGNVNNIVKALKNALVKKGFHHLAQKETWYFPTLSEYASLLEQNGFRVTFAAHFDRETLLKDKDGIRNWLQMFGKPYLQDLKSHDVEAILSDVEDELRTTNFKNNNWYADYVRLRIVAIKQTINNTDKLNQL